ncbi:histidine kinase 1 plant, putative [Ricinus communis]|uniref:histidine kinase n=1 Tax=Ricinus communis TaxID=3988 RepID=B9RFI1_RICCO|nr:histidine kinase 1 plant, putative [Ricinus communis]
MLTINASWFEKAKNSTSGYSSIGTGWNRAQDSLFLNTAAMDGRGVISLGFPTKAIIDNFSALDFHGGYFYLGTVDGQVIMQTIPPDTQIDMLNGSVTVQIFNPNGGKMGQDNLSCFSVDGKLRPLHGKIVGNRYIFYCSNLYIAGVQSVYVLAYPRDGLVNLVQRNIKLSTILLALVFVFIFTSFLIYMVMTVRATKREMFLCAALIKQTEATQQAERKSMNKTKAYAGANHDVRASLAAITGLIELCQDDVKSGSELATNLDQMQNCTRDLLEILNSVLDMSKIEAGKTSLEIEEFNLAQLLEDVVGMYYPLGMKKCVDIVLDPCDASKLPDVRGDRIKLKQILCNLLSNAIKFTSAGHVSVRAVVKKKNIEKEIIASSTTALKFLSWMRRRNKDACTDLDAFHTVKENPNEMEFEFEVDDTGQGIPKDKQTSIFEDYVQVKETAIGQEGCGLGLGIVQSLVRVMKGELTIIEKEPGERGTCFRFNVFLSTCESESFSTEESRPSSGFHQHFQFMSPKSEGSHMILFIKGDERRRVLKRYIESLNIKVTIIKHGRYFRSELEKIKRRLDLSYFASGKTDSSSVDYLSASTSSHSDPEANSKRLSIKDGADSGLPQFKKTNSKSSSGIILFVIDSDAVSSYREFEHTLVSFRKDIIKSSCKVVWLDDQISRQAGSQEQDRRISEGDYVTYKPFHGSRLTQVLSLLPERKGNLQCNLPKSTTGLSIQELRTSVDLNLSNVSSSSTFEIDITSSYHRSSFQQVVMNKPDEKHNDKPLNGKKVLVVEDAELLRRIVTTTLGKLGANVEACTNGEEALTQVCKALSDQKKEGDSKSIPYDYIFMDCEMPVMNGYEATRLIRIEERKHDVHIPIIALTAHAMPEEASKSIDAGMDFHLNKPLQVDKLLGVIQSIGNQ